MTFDDLIGKPWGRQKFQAAEKSSLIFRMNGAALYGVVIQLLEKQPLLQSFKHT